jgi:photosystem II stability/assembly factor-like uncharacterized protein
MNLNAVSFASSSTGWAAGMNGTLIRTTDGGSTWTLLSQPTTNTIFGLTGLRGDTNRLWLVGLNGVTVYTTNGGSTWLRPGQSAGSVWATTGSTLNALSFVGSSLGWAVGDGGTMLRTLDSGTSWRTMTGATGGKMEDIQFVNSSEGWAVGATGRILHTTNGGQTWSAQPWDGLNVEEGGTIPGLLALHFLDNQNGWVVGSTATILKTVDGGDTWETRSAPIAGSFREIAWLNAQRGWILGASGAMLGTEDGGETWSLLFSGSDKNLNQIAVIPAGPTGLTLWVVGDSGTLLKSTNGTDWDPIDLGTTENFNAVSFLPNGQTGWVAGDTGLLFRTTDGGANWQQIDAGTTNTLKALFAVNADEVWLGGQGGTLRVFR